MHDGDPEEVVKVTEVRHGELGVQSLGDVLEEVHRGGSDDDVFDVEEQVCDTITLFVYKREVPDVEAVKLRCRRNIVKRWYHAHGACFSPYNERYNRQM